MKSNWIVVVIGLLLAGCGGSSSSDEKDSVGLTEISGPSNRVYDGSYRVGGFIDEIYFVYFANGLVREYDYLGDNFDDGPDCFVVDEYLIEDRGNGVLRKVFDRNLSVDYEAVRIRGGYRFFERGILINNRYEAVDPRVATFDDYFFTNLLESQLRPLCQ